VGLAPTGKRRLVTAHANSGHPSVAWYNSNPTICGRSRLARTSIRGHAERRNATEPKRRDATRPSSSRPARCAATLDQRQSSAHLTNRARMGFNTGAWPEVRDRPNHLLGGWSAYFGYGTLNATYRIVEPTYLRIASSGFPTEFVSGSRRAAAGYNVRISQG